MIKSNLSDEQLIAEYLRGNESAFEFLLNRYLPLVYAFSRQYTGDRDKAADIAQETFVKVREAATNVIAKIKAAHQNVVDAIKAVKAATISTTATTTVSH